MLLFHWRLLFPLDILIQPFFVKGASMEPNFLDGDYLIIDEISYRFETPQRGEVVIFRYPLDKTQFFIKRIIGLPNENIKVQNGKVFINEKELNESEYLRGVETVGNVEIQLEMMSILFGRQQKCEFGFKKMGER